MKEHLTVVTRKGQITVPADVRRALGLKRGDKIAVRVEGTEARLAPAGSVVERTRGAVKTTQPPQSARQLPEEAERAWAADAMERGGGES